MECILRKYIISSVLHMLGNVSDIQVKMSGRMFQMSLEIKRKSWARGIDLGYQYMGDVTKRVIIDIEKKRQGLRPGVLPVLQGCQEGPAKETNKGRTSERTKVVSWSLFKRITVERLRGELKTDYCRTIIYNINKSRFSEVMKVINLKWSQSRSGVSDSLRPHGL